MNFRPIEKSKFKFPLQINVKVKISALTENLSVKSEFPPRIRFGMENVHYSAQKSERRIFRVLQVGGELSFPPHFDTKKGIPVRFPSHFCPESVPNFHTG